MALWIRMNLGNAYYLLKLRRTWHLGLQLGVLLMKLEDLHFLLDLL